MCYNNNIKIAQLIISAKDPRYDLIGKFIRDSVIKEGTKRATSTSNDNRLAIVDTLANGRQSSAFQSGFHAFLLALT